MKKAIILDETKLQKRKIRFWLFFGFFVTVLAAAVVCGIILGNHILQSDYTKLQTAIENNDTASMLSLYKNDDLLDYDIAVANYERYFLGTSNENILQDGKYYSNDKYSLDAINGKLIKTENGETKELINESVSFINVWEDTLYYRLDSTKMCMSLVNGQSAVAIPDLHVGQLLVDNGKIYFINLEDNAHLYVFDIGSSELKPIIDTPIQYFAIVGNKIIAMSRTNKFTVYDKKYGIFENGMANVKSFVFADKLYLSDGKTVVSCTPNLRKENKVATCDGNLIAVFEDAVVLQKETSLVYAINNIEYFIEKDVEICKSAAFNDGTLTYVIGRSSEDGYSELMLSKPIAEITQESNVME